MCVTIETVITLYIFCIKVKHSLLLPILSWDRINPRYFLRALVSFLKSHCAFMQILQSYSYISSKYKMFFTGESRSTRA